MTALTEEELGAAGHLPTNEVMQVRVLECDGRGWRTLHREDDAAAVDTNGRGRRRRTTHPHGDHIEYAVIEIDECLFQDNVVAGMNVGAADRCPAAIGHV